MKCSTATWKAIAAAGALMLMPLVGSAQTPPATQPPPAAQPATQPPPLPPAPAQGAALEHLGQAKVSLNGVATAALPTRARAQVAELKRRLSALERSMAANDSASATGQAKRSPRATSGARSSVNWQTEVAAMDKILTSLLDGQPTGTTGAPPSRPSTAVTFDDATRARLTEFRTHLTAYATAMAKPTMIEPAPPSTSTAEPPTQPPATPPTTVPPTVPPTAPPAAPPAEPAPQAKPDPEAARRHLTEARNSLSQMTQLPAAAQLTGDARTQVSQLITNFNELIAVQGDWRPVYAKVSANLTALIGPEPAAADPSVPSPTAGAVGTSGSGMNLDPTIRAKLVEIRKQLADFERAAGEPEKK